MNAVAYEQDIRRTIRTTARSMSVKLQPEDIADLVQETLLVLWQRRAEPQSNPLGYVRQAARNVAADALRRRLAKRRDERLTVSLEVLNGTGAFQEHGTWPMLELEELAEASRVLRQELLPHAFFVVCLRWFACMSAREVAALLGLAPSSVDSVVTRARQRMKQSSLSGGCGPFADGGAADG